MPSLQEIKESNPKDSVGTRKVPVRSVVPAPVIGEIALGMLEGARKYGRHNYRVKGVRASVYIDAAGRHLDAWWEGQDYDPDSEARLSHITKAITSLVVLRDAMIRGKMLDDRPPGTAGFIDVLNCQAGMIIDQYPKGVEPYLAQDAPDLYQG